MTKVFSTTEILKVDKSLGLVFGYAIVCKIDGEDHYDLQGHHIPENVMLKAMTNFMDGGGAAAKEMHTGANIGKVVFAFPMTTEIAKALDIGVKQTGAIIAMKPDNKDVLLKYASGAYTGFSIGGKGTLEDAE